MILFQQIGRLRRISMAAFSITAFTVGGCSSSDTDSSINEDSAVLATQLGFADGALASASIIDCTLSDGTETQCYELVTVGVPADSAVGPFCPETTTSSADDSGIWLDGEGIVYEADGNFILDLPNIYSDTVVDANVDWILYDVNGNVNVTDTQEACEAAARPDVDENYYNYCVECSLDYYGGGVSSTFVFPVTPIPADSPGAIGQETGVSLNGIQLAAAAPVGDILAAYTIAAFDDCGGHVNPFEGYHYHAATGCTELADTQPDGHASLLGYALDGYGIYGLLDSDSNEPTGLDECRGETDDVRGYHYHAASAAENMFIGCNRGKTVASDEGPGGPGGGGPGGPGG